jgi:hypothetical protein
MNYNELISHNGELIIAKLADPVAEIMKEMEGERDKGFNVEK